MALVSDTSFGGTSTGSLLQTNTQRLVDRLQGSVLTDINRVIDQAGQSVDIAVGAPVSRDPNATTNVVNSPMAQGSIIGIAAIAAVGVLALFALLR